MQDGGEYRNSFFGNDSLNHKSDNSFAIGVYNMKRYGIVSDRELIVLAETGEEISYQRDGNHALWQQVPLPAHGAERSKTAPRASPGGRRSLGERSLHGCQKISCPAFMIMQSAASKLRGGP